MPRQQMIGKRVEEIFDEAEAALISKHDLKIIQTGQSQFYDERPLTTPGGDIRITTVSTQAPSPFAANIAWGQITRYMYADDSPESNAPSALSDDLIRAAVFDAALRPRIDPAVIESFVAKRQRTAAGYAPVDAVATTNRPTIKDQCQAFVMSCPLSCGIGARTSGEA